MEAAPPEAEVLAYKLNQMELDSEKKQRRLEAEVEEASIYFRVMNGNSWVWYVIRNDSKTPLSPILVDDKVHQGSAAAAAALGSTIYIFGGGEVTKSRSFNSVRRIDTNFPEKGWDRVAELEHDRLFAHAVPVAGGKIVVFRGISYSGTQPPAAEIFGPDEKRCKTLKPMPPTIPPWKVTFTAVLDGGKQILFNCDDGLGIYAYNVEKDECVYTHIKAKCCTIDSMAGVDGDVYITGQCLRGLIMAIDVSERKKRPKVVMGLENIDWLPGRPGTEGSYPLFQLISMGRSKLAFLWFVTLGYQKMKVCCAKMEVSKEFLESGKRIFMARNVTRSKHYIQGFLLDLCLPV